MKKTYLVVACIVAFVMLMQACSKVMPAPPAADEILDGPIDGLTYAQNAQFLRGDIAFNDDVFTKETGLGPIFVTNSCGSCHAGDGKGHPFTTLTRFGQSDETGNKFLHLGGPQLQNRALPGFTSEQIPVGATFSNFTPPANTGLGFLELVSDADILAMADPQDANGDGISGVANWCLMQPFLTPHTGAIEQNGKYIHRFGKKAGAYNLLHQTANAYNQDMGIASVFAPKDVYTGLDIDPEVSTQTINDVVFYLRTLKAPVQRNQNDPDVVQGKILFTQIGCANCHKETLKTGYSAIVGLSFREFHPYTDMLLHDMGPALDDHYTEGSAKTYEWRTPPLWGLGLSPNSQGGEYFLLHDGRAKSIVDAILFHGGEATSSKNNYELLSEEEKEKLIKFLESL